MQALRNFKQWPIQVWLAFLSLICVGMFLAGMYLQHVVGLVPCPMCIVQRYALIGVAVFGAFGATWQPGFWRSLCASWLVLLAACFGAFVAARQTWLQWYPPEVVSCGRDFYGMVENFPPQRWVPMIFKGSGDCSKIDWTFLGGSLANWSFLAFASMVVLMLLLRWRDGLLKPAHTADLT